MFIIFDTLVIYMKQKIFGRLDAGCVVSFLVLTANFATSNFYLYYIVLELAFFTKQQLHWTRVTAGEKWKSTFCVDTVYRTKLLLQETSGGYRGVEYKTCGDDSIAYV